MGAKAARLVLGVLAVAGCGEKIEVPGVHSRPLDLAVIDEVRGQGKRLQAVQDAILMSRDRGARPFDGELAKQLVGAGVRDPDPRILGHEALCLLEPQLHADLIHFLASVGQLRRHLDDFARAAKLAESLPAKPLRDMMYAVVIRQPPDGAPFGELVELGAPICDDQRPHPEGCGAAPPRGFLFRASHESPWQKIEWGVGPDKLVPLGPTNTFAELAGGDRRYAEVAYTKALREIEELTGSLLEERREVEQRLVAAAAR